SRAWNSPSVLPPKRAVMATAKCAAVRRFSGANAVVPPGAVTMRAPPVSSLDDDLAPHGVVREAAVLVADHRVLARAVEPACHARDLARQNHDVDVGLVDHEPVDEIPARD